MAIPDQLPETPYIPTEEKRQERLRALRRVRQELYLATERLNIFLEQTDEKDVIKRIHTANTKVYSTDSDDPEVVRYYSLWTEDDTRLTASGRLLKSDGSPSKYYDMQVHDADTSYEVSLSDLESYTVQRLGSLSGQLEKFLKPRQ